MTSKRIFIKPYRPDLRWIETLLGESLQIPAQPPIYGTPNPQYDANAIPQGEYCYDFEAMRHDQLVRCPYFQYTDHDSVKCLYLGIEAVDGMTEKFLDHFGGQDKAEEAGVFSDYILADSIKACNVHLTHPATVKILQYRLDDYEQAILGKNRDKWDQPFYRAFWDESAQLKVASHARYKIWEALCGMTEEVPHALIERLQSIDAMLRDHTEPADTIIDNDFCAEIEEFTLPEKQFWYLCRKNFVWQGARSAAPHGD